MSLRTEVQLLHAQAALRLQAEAHANAGLREAAAAASSLAAKESAVRASLEVRLTFLFWNWLCSSLTLIFRVSLLGFGQVDFGAALEDLHSERGQRGQLDDDLDATTAQQGRERVSRRDLEARVKSGEHELLDEEVAPCEDGSGEGSKKLEPLVVNAAPDGAVANHCVSQAFRAQLELEVEASGPGGPGAGHAEEARGEG